MKFRAEVEEQAAVRFPVALPNLFQSLATFPDTVASGKPAQCSSDKAA